MAPEKYLLIRKAALTYPLVPPSPGEEWVWGRAKEAGRAGDQCQQPQRLRARQRTVRHSQIHIVEWSSTVGRPASWLGSGAKEKGCLAFSLRAQKDGAAELRGL